jgi:hypothetical protein
VLDGEPDDSRALHSLLPPTFKAALSASFDVFTERLGLDPHPPEQTPPTPDTPSSPPTDLSEPGLDLAVLAGPLLAWARGLRELPLARGEEQRTQAD